MQQSSNTLYQEVKYTGWTMFGLSLSVLVASLATSMINVALPSFTLAFHSSMQDVQWIVISYLLVITSLIVSVGRLGDSLGNKRLLLIGILIFTISSLASAMATSLMFLILTRAFQGLGAAIMLALSMALMSKSQAKTGKAMGLWGSVSAIGTALGPALGGISLSLFNWQSLFLISIPFAITAFLLVYLFLPSDSLSPTSETQAKKKIRFDLAGNLVLAVSLSAFALSMTLNSDQTSLLNGGLFGFSALGTWLFFKLEKRQESKHITPLIPVHMMNNKTFKLSFINCAISASVVMSCLVIGPYYLSITLALNTYQVGLVMSTGPLVVALSGLPAGKLTDKIGAEKMLLAGLFLMTIGCVFMSFNDQYSGALGYVLALVTITLGFSCFQTANSTDVMSKAEIQNKGVTSALLNLARNLGFITGATLMSSIFFYFIDAKTLALATPEHLTFALKQTFLIAGAFVFISMGLDLFNRLKKYPPPQYTRPKTGFRTSSILL